MNHKLAVKVAIIMLVVFGAITLLYPRIFAPKPPPDAQLEIDGAPAAPAAPVAAPPPTGP